jgi:hypothetical protein
MFFLKTLTAKIDSGPSCVPLFNIIQGCFKSTAFARGVKRIFQQDKNGNSAGKIIFL